ncbi:MAG: FAD-dependent oxidoreductase, partial [Candidatus Margulisiibacteriota bacterium]
NVTVFEKDDKIGGLLRFGIPAFKLDKALLDRRIAIWEQEGIEFKINSPVNKRLEKFDAMVLAGGSRVPRDLKVPGRELKGIYFALEYLTQSINVKGKKVVVIGGGDTGADCVHSAQRQGAKSITQLEIMPKPPLTRPWPWFMRLYQEEKIDRRLFSVATKGFKASRHRGIEGLQCIKVDEKLKEIPGTDFSLDADVVILALGFLHPEHDGLLDNLRVEYDGRGNVKTDGNYMTSIPGVFAAGDMRRGQSLIVWALFEGRDAAEKIHSSLASKPL